MILPEDDAIPFNLAKYFALLYPDSDALNVRIKLNEKGCIQLAKQSPDAATEADDRDRPGELLESPGDAVKQSPDAATAVEQGAEGANRGGRPKRGDASTDELMRRKVNDVPEAAYFTAPQWQSAIGKSARSIKSTPYWLELTTARADARLARSMNQLNKGYEPDSDKLKERKRRDK